MTIDIAWNDKYVCDSIWSKDYHDDTGSQDRLTGSWFVSTGKRTTTHDVKHRVTTSLMCGAEHLPMHRAQCFRCTSVVDGAPAKCGGKTTAMTPPRRWTVPRTSSSSRLPRFWQGFCQRLHRPCTSLLEHSVARTLQWGTPPLPCPDHVLLFESLVIRTSSKAQRLELYLPLPLSNDGMEGRQEIADVPYWNVMSRTSQLDDDVWTGNFTISPLLF